MSYSNDNQAILKKVVSDNPKAPALRLEITIDGVKYKAGLWTWTRKDGSPVTDKQGNGQYIGQIEMDTYGQEQQAQGMAQAKAAAGRETNYQDNGVPANYADFDDDIPF